jgi:hypothetical protein
VVWKSGVHRLHGVLMHPLLCRPLRTFRALFVLTQPQTRNLQTVKSFAAETAAKFFIPQLEIWNPKPETRNSFAAETTTKIIDDHDFPQVAHIRMVEGPRPASYVTMHVRLILVC